MATKVVAYKSSDGEMFETAQEADRHDEIQLAVPLAESLKEWLKLAESGKQPAAAGLLVWIRKYESEIRVFMRGGR